MLPASIFRLRRWVKEELFRVELRFAPTDAQRLFFLTLFIGAACGLTAVAFHFAIRTAESLLIGRAFAAHGATALVLFVALPTVGGLVCGGLLDKVVPGARGSGVPQVKISYARGSPVRLRDAVGKFLIGALQIGFGASLGREGPTVHICAGVASALGRAAGVAPQSRRRLIPVGAAAGIAAAFNAPLAAVTFTIEEIVGTLDQTVLSGVIVAAAIAAVIERSVLGTHPVFQVPQPYALDDAKSLLLYACLGVAAAVVSVVFTDALLHLRRRFLSLRRVPSAVRPAVGGLVTGVLSAATWAWLHVGGVNGGGYEMLTRSLSGTVAVRVMLVLCAVKLVATVFSYSSGGAGGIFAPSLFIGAMLGGSFGSLDVTLFGHPDRALGAFALVGMGAVFAGVIRAPITSVLIIMEMTSGYGLILPLMISNMTAYALAKRWRPLAIYEALLEQDGVHLQPHGLAEAVEGVKLVDLIDTEAAYVTFAPATSALEIVRATSRPSGQSVFPVVSTGGEMVGLITLEELQILSDEVDAAEVVTASDIMRGPMSVRPDDSLRAALERMRREGVTELPVIDEGGRVVGFINEGALARAYLAMMTARASGGALPRAEKEP